MKDITTEVFSDKNIFSSMEIVASVILPNKKVYNLGTLNMVSISTHVDKFPVTTLGSNEIKAFSYGIRTVAGTLVFATFDKTIWWQLMEESQVTKNNMVTQFLPDELPLFDISISFINDYGSLSFTGVQGVTILDEGETYSVDNITVMETYSYMAISRIPFQVYNTAQDISSFLASQGVKNQASKNSGNVYSAANLTGNLATDFINQNTLGLLVPTNTIPASQSLPLGSVGQSSVSDPFLNPAGSLFNVSPESNAPPSPIGN